MRKYTSATAVRNNVSPQSNRFPPGGASLSDPEPISLALTLFTVLIGAANFAVNVARYSRDTERDRSTIDQRLHSASRSLLRLTENYRTFVTTFDDLGLLHMPFSPVHEPIMVPLATKDTLDRARSDVFEQGNELQDSLLQLAGVLSDTDAELVRELSDALDDAFRQALASQRLIDFLIRLGILTEQVHIILDRVAQRYGYGTARRSPAWLQAFMDQLRRRE